MQVKVKDLLPNPYRNISDYPIDRDKVEALIDSINQTDFWDNLVARKAGKQFQIAYGHHRLKALQEVYGPDYLIEIPVKDLDDETMIKVMVNENMDEYRSSPVVMQESVRAVRDHLISQESEVPILDKGNFTGHIGHDEIMAFMGKRWHHRIEVALLAINATTEKKQEDGTTKSVVDKRALAMLDNDSQVKQFIREMRKADKRGKPFSPKKQLELAKEIVAAHSQSKEVAEKTRKKAKESEPKQEAKVMDLNELVEKIIKAAMQVDDGMKHFQAVISEGGLPDDIKTLRLINQLNATAEKLETFLTKMSN